MTGFNMPPGCSVSDIPGNRPEDVKLEAFYDAIYSKFDELGLSKVIDEVVLENLATFIFELNSKTYGEAYEQGQADESSAHAI